MNQQEQSLKEFDTFNDVVRTCCNCKPIRTYCWRCLGQKMQKENNFAMLVLLCRNIKLQKQFSSEFAWNLTCKILRFVNKHTHFLLILDINDTIARVYNVQNKSFPQSEDVIGLVNVNCGTKQITWFKTMQYFLPILSVMCDFVLASYENEQVCKTVSVLLQKHLNLSHQIPWVHFEKGQKKTLDNISVTDQKYCDIIVIDDHPKAWQLPKDDKCHLINAGGKSYPTHAFSELIHKFILPLAQKEGISWYSTLCNDLLSDLFELLCSFETLGFCACCQKQTLRVSTSSTTTFCGECLGDTPITPANKVGQI